MFYSFEQAMDSVFLTTQVGVHGDELSCARFLQLELAMPPSVDFLCAAAKLDCMRARVLQSHSGTPGQLLELLVLAVLEGTAEKNELGEQSFGVLLMLQDIASLCASCEVRLPQAHWRRFGL